MKKIYFIIAGLLSLYGCEKDISTYEWSDGVHFEVKQLGNLCDSSTYTFAFEEANVTELRAMIKVQLTGQVADYDRKINIEVESADKAPDGTVPYVFSTDTCYIRKGQSYLNLNITLNRNTDMQQKKYALRLKLNENESFKLTSQRWITDEVNNKSVDLLHHTIVFSDILTRPLAWFEPNSDLGKWSTKKFLLICEVTGFKRKDFQNQSYMSNGRKNYICDFMNRYFTEYKETHKNDPEALKKIREEDGSFMQMGK